MYNTAVTLFSHDNFKNYLNECRIVYDKKKDAKQVGSGSVVPITHAEAPFADSVALAGESVKGESGAGTDVASEGTSMSRKSDNKFLKTEIQESREKLDDADMALKSALRAAQRQGGIYYLQKNRAIQLAAGRGVQFPNNPTIADGYIRSIDDPKSKVKPQIINQKTYFINQKSGIATPSGAKSSKPTSETPRGTAAKEIVTQPEADVKLDLSRQSDNKFLKTEIQESREKLDDAVDSMALGTKTSYEPAEKRVDREERRALMLNYKSALRAAQRQTKLSRDIVYRLTASSVKRAADALRNAHPEITAQEAKVVTFGRGESATLYDTDDPFYQDGKAMIVSFDQDSLFDGDRVHEATSIHLGSTLEGTLVHLPSSATVFVKNKNAESTPQPNSPLRAKKPIDSASKDKIAQEDADVKSENAIKDSRMASQDAEFNKKLEEAGMAYDGETGTILHSRMYSTGQENAARVNRSKLVGMIADRLVKEGGMTREAAYARADSFFRAEEAAALF